MKKTKIDYITGYGFMAIFSFALLLYSIIINNTKLQIIYSITTMLAIILQRTYVLEKKIDAIKNENRS